MECRAVKPEWRWIPPGLGERTPKSHYHLPGNQQVGHTSGLYATWLACTQRLFMLSTVFCVTDALGGRLFFYNSYFTDEENEG